MKIKSFITYSLSALVFAIVTFVFMIVTSRKQWGQERISSFVSKGVNFGSASPELIKQILYGKRYISLWRIRGDTILPAFTESEFYTREIWEGELDSIINYCKGENMDIRVAKPTATVLEDGAVGAKAFFIRDNGVLRYCLIVPVVW